MSIPVKTRFFLGANSCNGFASLYGDWAAEPEIRFLYVIKGGPGCGKSSFMRSVAAAAEAKGLSVEYIQCSGDPASVDAIAIPSLGLAYVDGTAPHTMDCALPGARSAYLDLGRFYDFAALGRLSGELAELNSRYKSHYARAYRLLSAAGSCAEPPGTFFPASAFTACSKRADSLAAREFGKAAASPAPSKRRFLSAISCDGAVAFPDTAASLCKRICSVDNEFGLAPSFLARLAEAAARSGHDTVLCMSPLTPSVPEHLLVPSLSLAFLTSSALPAESKPYRHIRLDALIPRASLAELRPAAKAQKKLRRAIIASAVGQLAAAKALHDGLEALYNPHVDFEGVYCEAKKHADML